MQNSAYIKAAGQISLQKPLSEEWFDNPVTIPNGFSRAQDPDFKPFVNALESRRMGKILKRAIAVSETVMKDAGINRPDAIITGTGLGCNENNQAFLKELSESGEEMPKPTFFMNSTHNTISSLLAIRTGVQGYNSTYSHASMSFDCALQDALLQLSEGKAENILLGAHDEMNAEYYGIMKKGGLAGQGETAYGEQSAAFVLAKENENALCSIHGFEMLHKPDLGRLHYALDKMTAEAGCEPEDIDAIMTGINGDRQNDACYEEICDKLLPGTPMLRFKHIFGEGLCAPAIGLYATAVCIGRENIPAHLAFRGKSVKAEKILLLNVPQGRNASMTLCTSATYNR